MKTHSIPPNHVASLSGFVFAARPPCLPGYPQMSAGILGNYSPGNFLKTRLVYFCITRPTSHSHTTPLLSRTRLTLRGMHAGDPMLSKSLSLRFSFSFPKQGI